MITTTTTAAGTTLVLAIMMMILIVAQTHSAKNEAARALFSRIFDAEYNYVHHSLRRLGVQTRDLEDLAHDVFVTVYANLARYDEARPIRPWLFAFAFRLASDYRRLARHKTTLGVETERLISEDRSAEQTAMDRQAAEIVQRALDTIPLDQRAVFVMYEIDETPMKDIAETLEIPVNTAYSRLRLARAAFAAFASATTGGGKQDNPATGGDERKEPGGA